MTLVRLREASGRSRRGSTISAIACADTRVACAFASRSSVPEVVVWDGGGDEAVTQAGDLHPVTCLALAACPCFGSRSGCFAIRRGAVEALAPPDDDAPECAAADAAGAVAAFGVGRRVEVVACDGRAGDPSIAALEGHRGRVTGVAFRGGGDLLIASCSEDRTFKVWSLSGLCCVAQSAVLCASPLACVAFDDVRLAVGALDGRLWVFDAVDPAFPREAFALDARAAVLASTSAGEAAPAAPAGRVVISSEPRWRKPPDAPPRVDEASAEAAVSPLALAFDPILGVVVAASSHLVAVDLGSRDVRVLEALDGTARAAAVAGGAAAVGLAFEPAVLAGPLVPPDEEEGYRLSFFPAPGAMPPSDSPLRREIAPPSAATRTLPSYDARKKKTAATKKKGAVVDQPITFHAKIRSSGYGPGKPSASTRGAAARRRPPPAAHADYPGECGVLDTPQPQHDYVVPAAANPLVGAALVSLAFCGDAAAVAVAAAAGPPVIVRLPVAKRRGPDLTTVLGSGNATAVSFSHDGKWVVTSGHDGPPQVFPNARKQCVDAPALTLEGGGAGACFFYLDRFLLAPRGGALDMYAVALDDARGVGRAKRVHSFAFGGAKRVDALCCLNAAYAPLILAATSDRRISAVDAATGATARTWASPHGRSAHALAAPPRTGAAPQGSCDVFASAATDGVVALWDLRAAGVSSRFSGHANRREPCGVALSPCLRYLACGSEDKCAYVYDLRGGGSATPAAKLRGARDAVLATAFNPRHPQLATVSYDGGLRFYTDAPG